MSDKIPPMTPEAVSQAVQVYLDERRALLDASGEGTACGRRFSWCGDVLEFLTEGVADRLAGLGITFQRPFPGPFRLWDEEQRPDGTHVRRFWTTALERGCPIAKLCTFFFHRHDQVAVPHPPRVVGFPPDHRPDPREDDEDA